jgi:hypothetical protein
MRNPVRCGRARAQREVDDLALDADCGAVF